MPIWPRYCFLLHYSIWKTKARVTCSIKYNIVRAIWPNITLNESSPTLSTSWFRQYGPTTNPEHASLNWTECYDDNCQIHMSEKDGANYFPRKGRHSPRRRSASTPPEYQTTPQDHAPDPINYLPPPPPTQEPYYEHPDTICPPATADTPLIEGCSEEIKIAGQFIDMKNQLLWQYKPVML